MKKRNVEVITALRPIRKTMKWMSPANAVAVASGAVVMLAATGYSLWKTNDSESKSLGEAAAKEDALLETALEPTPDPLPLRIPEETRFAQIGEMQFATENLMKIWKPIILADPHGEQVSDNVELPITIMKKEKMPKPSRKRELYRVLSQKN